MRRPALLLLAVLGCAARPVPPPPPISARPAELVAYVPIDDPLAPDIVAIRKLAMDSVDAGDLDGAKVLAAQLLARAPKNATAIAIARAVDLAIDRARQALSVELGKHDAAPVRAGKERLAPFPRAGKVTLGVLPGKTSSTVRPRRPTAPLPSGKQLEQASFVPSSYRGLPLSMALSDGVRTIWSFGTRGEKLALSGPGADVVNASVVDLDGLTPSVAVAPHVIWAASRDDVLFVEISDEGGNARDTLLAIDAKTGDLYWRSPPRVANALSFTLGERVAYVAQAKAGGPAISAIELATGRVVASVRGTVQPIFLELEGTTLTIAGDEHGESIEVSE